jgi:hypothetical protein
VSRSHLTLQVEIPKAGPGGTVGVYFSSSLTLYLIFIDLQDLKGREELCRVESVDAGSPASIANLLTADVVLAINGTPVISAKQVCWFLSPSLTCKGHPTH